MVTVEDARVPELLTILNQMKVQIIQLCNIAKVLCVQRNENEDGSTHLTISQMSNKMLQSAEEIDKLIM